MEKVNIKQILHQQIDESNNDELLKQVQSLFEVNAGIAKPYVLSADEEKAVNEGLQDYKNGDVMDDDSFNKEMDEWSKE